MSVTAGARGENLSTVFTKAAEMLAFTIRTTRNEKHIPLRYHAELGAPCIALARKAMYAIYGADKTLSKETQKRLLEEADIALLNLQAEIHLLFLSFSFKPAKANEWISRLEDLQITFHRWARKIRGEC